MHKFDLGEIIENHIYVREIYSTWCHEKCLFSSTGLVNKLSRIHDYLGLKWAKAGEIKVNVKLPDNSNPIFKDSWHETILRKSDEKPLVTKIDRFSGYVKQEVVLGSSAWMGAFETFPGDIVIISPSIITPLCM